MPPPALVIVLAAPANAVVTITGTHPLRSRELTLEPGDLIACGTSLGAGVLRPGQIVEVAIDGVGVLRNQLG